jgi:GH24 family phage-related lysozyme (muramidase)
MKSGQHLKLPKSELGQMEADLRRQARMERLKIDIKVKDNGDDTVDIAWTVSDAAVPATSTAPAGGGGEGVTAAPPPTESNKPKTISTAPTGGSEPAPSAAAPSASAGPASLRPASPSATTAPAPTAPTSGSEPARSPAGPSVLSGLSETSEAGNRGAPSISSGAVPGGSSGKVPDQAVQIVTEFEGFVDHVYDDGVGVATIGYGTTRYPDGRRVRFGDPNITKATAKIYLSHDLETTVDQLDSSIPHWDEMDGNQRSALISFAYNLGDHFYGGDQFKTINSTLRDKRWGDVPKAMELYSNPNDPKIHPGLLRRRKAEGELWQGKGPFAK